MDDANDYQEWVTKIREMIKDYQNISKVNKSARKRNGVIDIDSIIKQNREKYSYLNKRNSMTTAVENPFLIGFVQPERHSGKSSYKLIDYFKEAINAISVGKSLATRLSFRIGFFLFLISLDPLRLVIFHYLFHMLQTFFAYHYYYNKHSY